MAEALIEGWEAEVDGMTFHDMDPHFQRGVMSGPEPAYGPGDHERTIRSALGAYGESPRKGKSPSVFTDAVEHTYPGSPRNQAASKATRGLSEVADLVAEVEAVAADLLLPFSAIAAQIHDMRCAVADVEADGSDDWSRRVLGFRMILEGLVTSIYKAAMQNRPAGVSQLVASVRRDAALMLAGMDKSVEDVADVRSALDGLVPIADADGDDFVSQGKIINASLDEIERLGVTAIEARRTRLNAKAVLAARAYAEAMESTFALWSDDGQTLLADGGAS